MCQDIAISTLLVSSKLEDTLKKLREIQVAAFQVKAAEEGLTSLAEPDQQALEADRARLIGVERLILETISFNFNLRSTAAYATRASKANSSQNRDVFAYVIKLGSFLGGTCSSSVFQPLRR
jgi:CTD kinase subunit beta